MWQQIFGFIFFLSLAAVGWWLLWLVLGLWHLTHPPRHGMAVNLGRDLPADPTDAGYSVTEQQFHHAPCWQVTGQAPEAPRWLLIHDYAKSRYAMIALLDSIAPCAAEIWIPDLPGHGDHEQSCFQFGKTELALIEQIIKTLSGLEPHRPIVLLGTGFGGWLATAADAHPAVIGSVITGGDNSPNGPIIDYLNQQQLPRILLCRPLMIALRLCGLMPWRLRSTPDKPQWRQTNVTALEPERLQQQRMAWQQQSQPAG